MRGPVDDAHSMRAACFRAFVGAKDFPCVGAKSALARGRMSFFVGSNLRKGDDDARLLRALYGFIDRYRRDPALFTTFVAIFHRPRGLREATFERALWQRLDALHRLDRRRYRWDPRVSADPDSPHFSFSLKSEACFVVGLHDNASRRARRFQWPTLVFNMHVQFERLRREGMFDTLRDAIRQRDVTLDGDANPMVKSYGEGSEARQYSGRMLPGDWQCPFHPAEEDAAP